MLLKLLIKMIEMFEMIKMIDDQMIEIFSYLYKNFASSENYRSSDLFEDRSFFEKNRFSDLSECRFYSENDQKINSNLSEDCLFFDDYHSLNRFEDWWCFHAENFF